MSTSYPVHALFWVCCASFPPPDVSSDKLVFPLNPTEELIISVNTLCPKRNLVVSSPPPVHRLDRLHSESGGNQVVSVVSPPAHHQQTLDFPHHKDKTSLYEGRGCTASASLYCKYADSFRDRDRVTVLSEGSCYH